MATTTSGASPDKQRKGDASLKAEALRLASKSRRTQDAARQLGSRSKLLYRWPQAQLVAAVDREKVARNPEGRALRAPLGSNHVPVVSGLARPPQSGPFLGRPVGP